MVFSSVHSPSHLVDDEDGAVLIIAMSSDTIEQRIGFYSDPSVTKRLMFHLRVPPMNDNDPKIVVHLSSLDSDFRHRGMRNVATNTAIVSRILEALSAYRRAMSPERPWAFTSDFAELEKRFARPLFKLPEGLRTI